MDHTPGVSEDDAASSAGFVERIGAFVGQVWGGLAIYRPDFGVRRSVPAPVRDVG